MKPDTRSPFPRRAIVVFFLFILASGAQAVQWHRWSPATPSLAARAGKPVVLLIRHGVCHPCRQIENAVSSDAFDAFTPVLLDADESPRTAASYLAWLELSGCGKGELPALLVATPHLEPLAAAAGASPGIAARFLEETARRWAADRDSLVASAGLSMRRIRSSGRICIPPDTPATRAVAAMRAFRGEDEQARTIALTRLRDSAASAVYDHLGGGFFERPRDEAWRVPRFDKLLRDQALAVLAYTEAWQITRDPLFRDVARATATLLIRDFRDNRTGLFFNALGSHSLFARRGPEMLEGAHYVWSASEIRNLLGDRSADLFMEHYGVTAGGNVSEVFDPAGDMLGKNVLFRPGPPGGVETEKTLEAARAILLQVRSRRPPPARDERLLAETNALAISALARAGSAFDVPAWRDAAARAMRSLAARRDFTKTPAADRALIDVWEATFDPHFLDVRQNVPPGRAIEQVPDVVAGLAAEDDLPATPVSREILIAGSPGAGETEAFLRVVRERFLPDARVHLVASDAARKRLATSLPDVQCPRPETPCATVCIAGGGCRTPTDRSGVLAAWLGGAPASQPAPR
ncbi:MAG TPA: DUF255 domain-containing protein [Thermoanaerobaculia bacterium]|nr:DUF255 domain-containing protein [Thermoanaerobaculia bacterium]